MTERVCHRLTAVPLVTGSVDLEAAVEAERKRKPRGPSAFKQAEVQRAVKAVKAAGVEVGKVEITKDKIIVSGEAKPEQQTVTPLDLWRARHAKG